MSENYRLNKLTGTRRSGSREITGYLPLHDYRLSVYVCKNALEQYSLTLNDYSKAIVPQMQEGVFLNTCRISSKYDASSLE